MKIINTSKVYFANKAIDVIKRFIDNAGEDVIVDFTTASKSVINNVIDIRLKELIEDDRVKKILFVQDSKIVTNVKIICSISNLSEEKIEYIKIVKKTGKEKRAEKFYENMTDENNKIYRIEGSKLILDLENTGVNCIDFFIDKIYEFIKEKSEENNIDTVIINSGKRFAMTEYQCRHLANLIKNLNINVDFELYSEKASEVLEINIKNNKVENKEQNNLKVLKEGQCGIFIKYKSSRAVDDTGREGYGEIKIQTFSRIESIENGKIKFRIFKSDRFSNRIDYFKDTGEKLEEMQSEVISIDAKDLGLNEEYYGRKAQFLDNKFLNSSGITKSWNEYNENGEYSTEVLKYGDWISRIIGQFY